MAPPDDYRMESPAAFYVGAPSPAGKRVANAILDSRPGALIVFASEAARGQRYS
jgi:hypothetical protein